MYRIFSIPSLNLPGSFVLSVLMSLFAVILALIFGTADRFLCMTAMILSTGGDILLMNFRGLKKYLPDYFAVGAIFFMAAHVVYTAAFTYLIKIRSYSLINTGFIYGIILIAAAFVLLTYLTIKTGHFRIGMYILCFVYLIIIGANCCVIFSFAYSAGGWALYAAAGALSFFISDAIIGLDRLAGITSPLLNELIWWFYPVGQVLILIGG
jgi:uncharacterized membrane protein YhhN